MKMLKNEKQDENKLNSFLKPSIKNNWSKFHEMKQFLMDNL